MLPVGALDEIDGPPRTDNANPALVVVQDGMRGQGVVLEEFLQLGHPFNHLVEHKRRVSLVRQDLAIPS